MAWFTDHVVLGYEIYLYDQDLVEQEQQARSVFNNPVNDPAGVMTRLSLLFGRGKVFAGPDRAVPHIAALGHPGTAVVHSAGGGAPPPPPYVYVEWVPSTLYPRNVDRFERLITPLINGKFSWRGRYRYKPKEATDDDGTPQPTPENIAQRRWIDGFELPQNGEGANASALGDEVHRDASRHEDGYGLAIRGTSSTPKSHNVDEYQAGFTTTKSWERLYIRLRSAPTGPCTFWRCHGSTSGNAGIELQITPTGTIAIMNVSSANVQTLMGSSPALTVDQWVKLDLLFEYGATSKFRLFLNGAISVDIISLPSGVGLGQAQNHASSDVSSANAEGADNLGLDIDDWFNADYPANLTGIDFLNGSKMRRVDAISFTAGHGAWVGDAEFLLQNPARDGLPLLTSSTANAAIEVLTDVTKQATSDPQAIDGGIVAMVVGLNSTRGSTSGQLGFSKNAAAFVMTAITQGVSLEWDSVMYRPTGLQRPEALSVLALRHTKGNAADAATVRALAAVVEMIGVWGEEDVRTSLEAQIDPPDGLTGTHMSPYFDTPWNRAGPAPLSGVQIKSGTYVGTGTKIDLTFRWPLTWFWVRRVTAAELNSTHWWSSMMAANVTMSQPNSPEGLVKAQKDPAFTPSGTPGAQESQWKISIIGNDTTSNAAGATYQYIAVGDPGMRFHLNSVLRHHRNAATKISNLWKTAYLAECGWFHQVTVGGASTIAHYFKGKSQASAVSKVDAAETANAASFGAGTVTSQSAFHFAGQEISASLWRQDDTSTAADRIRMCRIGSYTGDGAGSRVVTMAPESGGFRPLFLYVSPHNGAGVYRDPSHTGTTSTTIRETLNAATGITAGGVDTFTVGSALNANGVVYDYFCILGCSDPGNGGWSVQCDFDLDPIKPPDWEDDGDDDPDDDPEDDPGDDDDDGDDPPGGDLDGQCITPSTKVINQALSFIGISRQITDIVNDASPESVLARLHYADAVAETLRDYPWTFATRYADLVLVAGTATVPVNDDWQYSYRAPADMIFPRRIVRPEKKRAYDPDPPKWRAGTDNTGRLIYTDMTPTEAPQLEYTYRPDCAANKGDPLFRMALAYLMAHKLAPALAKNKVTAAELWGLYQQQLTRAKVPSASESQPSLSTGDADWISGR